MGQGNAMKTEVDGLAGSQGDGLVATGTQGDGFAPDGSQSDTFAPDGSRSDAFAATGAQGDVGAPGQWLTLCQRADLVAQSGVVAWLDGEQVALFYLPERTPAVYALSNRDPQSGANVIGRGIVGELQGELVVAAPLYKQHFSLLTGRCQEDAAQVLRTWAVRLKGELVEVRRGG